MNTMEENEKIMEGFDLTVADVERLVNSEDVPEEERTPRDRKIEIAMK